VQEVFFKGVPLEEAIPDLGDPLQNALYRSLKSDEPIRKKIKIDQNESDPGKSTE